jgi:hypothetical protein
LRRIVGISAWREHGVAIAALCVAIETLSEETLSEISPACGLIDAAILFAGKSRRSER